MKVLRIVQLVAPYQLGDERSLLRPRAGPPQHSRADDWMRNDDSLRGTTLGARSPLNEDDDGAQDVERRIDIAFVDAQRTAAEAHHHVTIAR